jgi:hypothetical protein
LEKGYIKIAKDTMGVEDQDETEGLEKLKKSKQLEHIITDSIPAKKEDLKGKPNTDALLPERQKRNHVDSVH